MTGDARFEHAVQFRQNLLEITRRHHATQFLGGLMMGHREVMIGRGKPFRLLFRHHLAMLEKSEMRFGESLRPLEILFDERRDPESAHIPIAELFRRNTEGWPYSIAEMRCVSVLASVSTSPGH